MDFQKGYFGRSKIKFSSKVHKFERQIRIDLMMVFYINMFFVRLLVFEI